MKRFHAHLSVDDLDANGRFYSAMFGTAPTVLKPAYAKGLLGDSRVNFAISRRGSKPGVDHLGVRVKSKLELTTLREQAAAAEIAAQDQPNAVCCYARSDEYRMNNPQGIAWGTCHTLDSVPVYGDTVRAERIDCCGSAPRVSARSAKSGACCA